LIKDWHSLAHSLAVVQADFIKMLTAEAIELDKIPLINVKHLVNAHQRYASAKVFSG
jgi:hypothetical protein